MWGKKKPTAKEIAKDTKRDIRKEQRSLEREINTLQREEAKVIAEIKKAAKNGDQVKLCPKCIVCGVRAVMDTHSKRGRSRSYPFSFVYQYDARLI